MTKCSHLTKNRTIITQNSRSRQGTGHSSLLSMMRYSNYARRPSSPSSAQPQISMMLISKRSCNQFIRTSYLHVSVAVKMQLGPQVGLKRSKLMHAISVPNGAARIACIKVIPSLGNQVVLLKSNGDAFAESVRPSSTSRMYVSPTLLFLPQKLDEIFNKIDAKNDQAGKDHELIETQQTQLEHAKLDIDKLKTDIATQRSEHDFKLEQIRQRIAEVRSKITKQEKEDQLITQKMAEMKQDQEKLNNRRDILIEQINVA